MASKSISKNLTSKQTKVALWGPSGAGKDWLFQSFVQELEYYNRRNEDFHYNLLKTRPGETDLVPVIPKTPENIPTSHPEDINYVFKREALILDEAHLISVHEHDMLIHNDAGKNLVSSLNDKDTFESTFQTLIQAQSIFLVLGIPNEEGTAGVTRPDMNSQPDTESDKFVSVMNGNFNSLMDHEVGLHSTEALSGNWSNDTYFKFMQLLLNALSNSRRRNLAVCMTKSDLLNFRGEDSWEMLERRHGVSLLNLLRLHQQKHNIEVFATSAAGYVAQGDRVMPNISPQGIREVHLWNPINTAAPFFWIFEQIELERLRTGPIIFRTGKIKKYISYPSPRPF